MNLNNLIPEINDSSIEAKNLFFGKPIRNEDLNEIKTYFIYQLKALTNNDDVNLFTGEKLPSVLVSIDESDLDFTYRIVLLDNITGLLPLSNLIVNYQLTGTTSPQTLSVAISSNFHQSISKMEVYVRTDIDYLQFVANNSDFILNADGYYEASGNVYGLPTNTQIHLKFFDTNNNFIFSVTLEELEADNKYIVYNPDFFIKEYKATDIIYLINTTTYPIFTNEGGVLSYTRTVPKNNYKENFSIEVGNGNISTRKYAKTYLPISYKDFPFLRTYSYDFALVMLVFLSEYLVTRDETIKQLIINMFNSSKRMINSRNSFNFSYPAYSFVSDEYIRNGAVAWMLEALSKAYAHISELQTTSNLYHIKSVADYLVNEIQGNNLVRGGYGRYDSNGNFDPDFVVPWYSTEHNIDSYFALKSVYNITNDEIYLQKAEDIKTSLLNNNMLGNRLTQGYNDDAGALDIYTWGTIFLYKIGEDLNRVYKNYSHLDQYFLESGRFAFYAPSLYFPYAEELGYPGAKKLIWFEGYFQALYTKYLIWKNNMQFEQEKYFYHLFIVKDLLPYSVGKDTNYEIGEYPSIASVSWFLFFYYLYFNNIESFWH